MKTFQARILVGYEEIESFTVEEKSGHKALEAAKQRFEKAYPFVKDFKVFILEK